MLRVGDTVFFTDEEDNIPYGSLGEVVGIEGGGVNVKFEGVHHRNPYTEKDVWLCCETNLAKLTEAPESVFEQSTLTIPLANGVNSLTGEFSDSNGDVYEVHVQKLPLMRQSKV